MMLEKERLITIVTTTKLFFQKNLIPDDYMSNNQGQFSSHAKQWNLNENNLKDLLLWSDPY